MEGTETLAPPAETPSAMEGVLPAVPAAATEPATAAPPASTPATAAPPASTPATAAPPTSTPAPTAPPAAVTAAAAPVATVAAVAAAKAPTPVAEGTQPAQPVKPRCASTTKNCQQRPMSNYAFCVRHILEDKSAPYKQCAFVMQASKKQCSNPIPIAETHKYCNQHMRILGLLPKKADGDGKDGDSKGKDKRSAGDSSDTATKRAAKRKRLVKVLRSIGVSERSEAVANATMNRQKTARGKDRVKPLNTSSILFDKTAVSSSEGEDLSGDESGPLADVSDATAAQDLQAWLLRWEEGVSESENDSDGDSKDKLKAALLGSREEMFTRRAHLLEKLRLLYHSQFVRLQRELRSRYRRYRHTRGELAAERESLKVQGGMNGTAVPAHKRKLITPAPASVDPEDIDATLQHSYQRARGDEAALRLSQIRQAALREAGAVHGPGGSMSAHFLKCAFQHSFLPPCQHRALPYTRFCGRHILKDTQQQLFKSCHHRSDGGTRCERAILRSQYPPYCEDHLDLDQFEGNPRLCVRRPAEDEASEAETEAGAAAGPASEDGGRRGSVSSYSSSSSSPPPSAGAAPMGLGGTLDADFQALIGGSPGFSANYAHPSPLPAVSSVEFIKSQLQMNQGLDENEQLPPTPTSAGGRGGPGDRDVTAQQALASLYEKMATDNSPAPIGDEGDQAVVDPSELLDIDATLTSERRSPVAAE